MKNSTKLLIAGIVVGVIVVAAVGIKQHVTADQEVASSGLCEKTWNVFRMDGSDHPA